MPIGLGIGLTITRVGISGGGFSLTAPELAFASATDPSNDNTQALTASFTDSIEGKAIRLVGTYGSSTVSAPYDVDELNEVSNAENIAMELAFAPGAATDGVIAYKCWIVESLLDTTQLSGASNTVSKTIDTTAPTITSATTGNNAENSVLAHSLTANETVTWTVTGGADQARFEISGSTLRWASNGTKDYETPNDADTNNTYVVQVTATDTAGNTANQTVTITVTNVDDTAPSLTSATDTATGQTTADVGVDTDEANGTLYCVVTTSSTSPTAAQVKAGQDNSGVSAAYASSQAISSTGTKAFSATGLTASTAYTAHFMHEDATANQSTVVKGDGFTTSSSSATWNSADKAANLTLSGSDLIVTSTSDGFRAIRATASVSSGKKYYEIKATTMVAGGTCSVGIGNSSASLTNYVGSDANGRGQVSDGTLFTGLGAAIQTWAVNDWVCIAVDFDNMKIWWRTNGGNWNNSATADPATNTEGRNLTSSGIGAGPYFPMANVFKNTDSLTANFGGSAYSQTPPSGFGNW